MKTDRVFVLLLVVLLPLSGCFDGSVGDADATDDSSESTTVINNYYNNTTVMEQNPIYEYITFTVPITYGSSWIDNYDVSMDHQRVSLDADFNTSSNTIIEVVYASITGINGDGNWNSGGMGLDRIYYDSVCDERTYTSSISAGSNTQMTHQLDGTIGSTCSINLMLQWYNFPITSDMTSFSDGISEVHIELAMIKYSAVLMPI